MRIKIHKLLLFFLSIFFFLIIPSDALAASPTPIILPSNVGASDAVYTIANDGDISYLGGYFEFLGVPTVYLGQFSSTTGAKQSFFPQPNRVVAGVVSDRNGGYYVAGSFTSIGGDSTRRYLVHILSDGTIDTNFNPSPNNTARTLALSHDGTTLYVSGQFTSIGGASRNRLAALNATTGAARAFDINLTQPFITFFDFKLSDDDSIIYVAGNFTAVNDNVPRNRLAAFTTSNGTVTAFDPDLNGPVASIELSSDGSIIYAGGSFTAINGLTSQAYLAAFDTSDGTATSFNPVLDQEVMSLDLSDDGNTLFAGGRFTDVNSGTTRNKIAAFNTTNGTATSFNPNINVGFYATSIKLSSDESILYAAGNFDEVNGGTVRNNFAAFNTSNSAVTSLDIAPDETSAILLSDDGSRINLWGSFIITSSVRRQSIGAINNQTGEILDFNPNIVGNNTVWSIFLSPDKNTIYAAGEFNSVNSGTTRNHMAAFDKDGVVTSFDPNFDSDVYSAAISSDGNTIYAGGNFLNVNGGTTRNHLAAVSASNGNATSFNPDVDGYIQTILLSPDDSTLYFGGDFSNINTSTPRNNLASVSTSTGVATNFDPNVDNDVWSLALANNVLYAGGDFSTVNGGTTRNYLAGFNASDGSATSFDPDPDSTVLALTYSNTNTLYAGGFFFSVNGGVTDRPGIAGFDIDTGIATDFNPSFDFGVTSLVLNPDQDTLFTGGYFFDTTNGNFASFAEVPVPSPLPTSTPTPTPTSGGGGGGGSSPQPSNPGSSTCTNIAPQGTPNLFQINIKGTNATLYFAPVNGANNYLVSYGTDSNASQYNVGLTGWSNGVVSYTVGSLNPNTVYNFKVSSGNGCMQGSFGNIMAAKTAGNKSTAVSKFYKNTFVAVTSQIFPVKKTTTLKTMAPAPIQSTTTVVNPTNAPIVKPASPVAKSAPVKTKSCFLFICW